MNTKISILLTAVLAVPSVRGERTEELILQKGAPTTVVWTLDKNAVDPETQGSAYFEGGMPGTMEKNGSSIWKVPAFETKGGTRMATGFSVKFNGGLKARFHADAATTHKRRIEGESRWAGLVVTVNTNSSYHSYQTKPGNWSDHEIPPAQQRGTLEWHLNHKTDHVGWVLRETGPLNSKPVFNRIRDGEGVLELSASYKWLPYFELKRDWFGTGVLTFFVDTSTTKWSIPNEIPPPISEIGDHPEWGTAYPADSLGRRVNYLAGLPGYPIGMQSQFSHEYVKHRTGAAEPIEVTVVWHYTQIGDTDHGNPYQDAGMYSEEFQKADGRSSENHSPKYLGFAIPGNRKMEYSEFNLMLEDGTAISGGFQLYDWDAADQEDPAWGRTRSRHYFWMDADRNGSVSMEEYKDWRDFLIAVTENHTGSELLERLPDKNWKKLPTPRQALLEMEKIPHHADALILKALDSNLDSRISGVEWKYLQNPAAKRTSFDRMDSNHDGFISDVEIAGIPLTNYPLEWASAHKKGLFFAQLDIGDFPDHLTMVELKKAWPPGTSRSKISSQIQRMRGDPTKEPIGLNEWFLMKTRPSHTKWKSSSAIRRKRGELFHELTRIVRPGGFTILPGIRVSEFAKLYPKGTSKVKIRKAWRIATMSPQPEKPPTYLLRDEFIECRILGATIR